MTRRGKLLRRLNQVSKGNVRFRQLISLAEHFGFTWAAHGSDYVFRHPGLPYPLLIGRPHAGRDRVWPHDVDRLADAISSLIAQGFYDSE